MKILAISGSARRKSTNTALLMSLKAIAPSDVEIDVYAGIGELPIFSPDVEGLEPPESVKQFIAHVANSDGVLISSPEYVRGIPGGLKNAIDWLVSGEQIVGKPIALVHASHRGDDMLAALRTVLSTISSSFNNDLLLRVPVMNEAPERVAEILRSEANRTKAEAFLSDSCAYCNRRMGNLAGDSIGNRR